jgi:hypothetical protein
MCSLLPAIFQQLLFKSDKYHADIVQIVKNSKDSLDNLVALLMMKNTPKRIL